MSRSRFNGDPSKLRELGNTGETAEAAVARRTHTAEWHLGFVVHGRAIHMTNSRPNTPRDSQAPARIFREHRRREPIFAVVGQANGILLILGADHRGYRAETFFGIDAH